MWPKWWSTSWADRLVLGAAASEWLVAAPPADISPGVLEINEATEDMAVQPRRTRGHGTITGPNVCVALVDNPAAGSDELGTIHY